MKKKAFSTGVADTRGTTGQEHERYWSEWNQQSVRYFKGNLIKTKMTKNHISWIVGMK